MRLRSSRLAALLLVPMALTFAAGAGAAPLTETEPNDNLLYANGPVPADGFVRTKNVADDTDYFKVQFKGGRQVSATAVRLTGGSCSQITLTRADGGWAKDFVTNPTPHQQTWTTPRDDTVYLGRTASGGNGGGGTGCQSLISFAPADAVIVTPIADPPAYDRAIDGIAVAAKTEVATALPFTVTGRAVDAEKVVAWLVDGACGASPSVTADPGESAIKTESEGLGKGTFVKTLSLTTPDAYRPQMTLCVWVVDTLAKLQPLLKQTTVQVGEPPIRTLAVSAPSTAAPSASIAITTSGIAAASDRLEARLIGGGCGPSPATTASAASAQSDGSSLSTGPYSDAMSVSAPASSAPMTLCVWLHGASGTEAILFQQAVTVAATATTALTISYRLRRYRGRVTSANTACYRGARVQLRRRGKGTKSYGSTVTRQDGSWTIRRSKVRGKMYAVYLPQTRRGVICGASTSSALRKRH